MCFGGLARTVDRLFSLREERMTRQKHLSNLLQQHSVAAPVGPLAQSAERGADNAKVVSSSLTRTTTIYF